MLGKLDTSEWKEHFSFKAKEQRMKLKHFLAPNAKINSKWNKDLNVRPEGFPGGSDGKSICLQCRRPRFDPWVGKIPWRRKWQPTPVFLPGKSHGWWSLVGYCPWGPKESDMTEDSSLLLLRPETMKLLEENKSVHSWHKSSKILYDPPSRVMEIKTKIKKWDLIKLKSFCIEKERINKIKR